MNSLSQAAVLYWLSINFSKEDLLEHGTEILIQCCYEEGIPFEDMFGSDDE